MTTSGDGRDWIVFRIDDYALQTLHAEVDLKVRGEVEVYERQASVALRSEGDWNYVPDFGNVRLSEDDRGRSHLTWRTALNAPQPEWGYSLRDPTSGFVRNGQWSGLSFSFPPSALTFQMSPVSSYPGNVTPGSLPAVFTPKHLAATLNRELNCPQIRLADYAAAPR
jgi:hypothetical protein